jgi:branched-chain amino acid transport system permease protein
MSSALLEARGLTKTFGGLVALRDVELAVRPREILGLIGPNGSGKTTFFNVVTGLYRPTAGGILFGDNREDVTRLKPHEICQLGIARTFQNSRLWPNMTVLENVLVGMHARLNSGIFGAILRTRATLEEERAAERSVVEVLRVFGDHLLPFMNHRADSLSYANRRRLEIARALAVNPTLLLLDEPGAGMDPAESQSLISDLRRIHTERNLALLVIEHDMSFMEDLAQRVIVFDHGEKIAEGTFQQVSEDPAVIEAYLGTRQAVA